jgi:glutathione S-transferase
MTMKLYFAPGACSFVPHVMLEISGQSYEPVMVKLHKGEQYGDEFKALNPRSQVPVLVADGQVICQLTAICQYIALVNPAAQFFPAEPIELAKTLETLAWMNNTVHPTFTHIFLPHKFHDQPEIQNAIKNFATIQYRQLIANLEQLVVNANAAGLDWLGGQHLGPLDAYALTLTRWASMAGIDPEGFPVLWQHVQKTASQAAVARVIERERLTLNLFKPG